MEDGPSQSSRVAKAPVVPNPFGSVGLEWVPLEGPIFFPSEEVRLGIGNVFAVHEPFFLRMYSIR